MPGDMPCFALDPRHASMGRRPSCNPARLIGHQGARSLSVDANKRLAMHACSMVVPPQTMKCCENGSTSLLRRHLSRSHRRLRCKVGRLLPAERIATRR